MTLENDKNQIKQQQQQEKEKHDREMLNLSKRRNMEQERHQKITQSINRRKERLINAKPVSSNESLAESLLRLLDEIYGDLDQCNI